MLDQLMPIALWAHAGSTLFMVGLIWFVQVVHYPLMAHVPADAYPRYADLHQARTSLVVGPAMLIELASCLALLLADVSWLTIAGTAMLAAIWASTAFVQMPLHARLSRGFDADVCRRLVRSNWLRTVLWSARGIVALALVAEL